MANADFEAGTILVLGGTGKTGRRVADLLRETASVVRVGSRAGEPPFDWENRTPWTPALRGVRAAYVAFQPDLAVPVALETVQAFFNQAVESGVKKLVLLSGRGEIEAVQAAQALLATSVEWTILRSSWFCQNFSESFLLDPILAGEVSLPAGLAAEPFVDVDDIAEIACAALTEPGHAGKRYEITGPRAMTFAEATREIAEMTGQSKLSVMNTVGSLLHSLTAALSKGERVTLVGFGTFERRQRQQGLRAGGARFAGTAIRIA